MKLVVGAPVGPDRAWALPRWFEALAAQTRPPDEYVLVVQDNREHDIVRAIRAHCPVKVPALSYAQDRTDHFIPRDARQQHEAETVYGGFARRRNQLRELVLRREPDVLLSLDTDIMFENPRIIEWLLAHMERLSAEVAAPCVYLHPAGRASECYNAAWWAAGDPGSPDRAWRRATAEDAAKGVQEIGIPMAAVLMTRRVAETCRYRYHAQGEDMGFAQDLDRLGYRCVWNADLETRHVMSEDAL